MKNGFTLIEILVVFVIITILSVLTVPFYLNLKNDAQVRKNIVTNCVPNKVNKTIEGDTVREVSYDGCQYIIVGWGNCKWGAHKGNCNNPIHQYRVEK